MSEPLRSGWRAEADGDYDMHDSPHGALMSYLADWRSSYEDDEREDGEIGALRQTHHRIIFWKEVVLASEEQRDAELAGLDDEEAMLDISIGGKYLRYVKAVNYILSIGITGDEDAGALTISYKRDYKETI